MQRPIHPEPETQNTRLTTKLFVPPVGTSFVPRPRLVEQLNKGIKGKLTLVCAPAGFGKSSLIASWLRESGMPAAWVSLDSDDNEPVRFLDYLLAAIQSVSETLGETAAAFMRSSHPAPLKPALGGLINEIAEYSGEFVIVLDDYHLIHERTIHESVTFFLEHLPPQARVLIASRSDLPFPVARLRASGELTEIRVVDLRFDAAESADFLNGSMNLELSDEDIGMLGNRTEGWITGLQLAALSLKGRENKVDLISEFAGNDRFVLDYLVEEVLGMQSAGVQNFLLQTSVLNRLSGPLCDELTGDADGQSKLEELERANLFLFPLDTKSQWFRYHHLFADLLRFKLTQKEPGKVEELQVKASFWCEENGLAEEAIGYALAAKRWSRALSLIEPIGYRLVSLGKFERLQRWIEAVPETALKSHPLLCFWYIPTLLYKDRFEQAEKLLQIVETAEPEDLRRRMLSAVWSSRCFIAVTCGDADLAAKYSDRAFELLPPDDVIQFAVAKHTKVAQSLLTGDMKRCEENLLDALPAYRKANHYLFETWMKTYLGFVRAKQGFLSEGAQHLRDAIAFAREHIPDRPDPLIYPNSFLCDISRERNDFESAAAFLEETLKLIEQTGRMLYMVLDLQNLKSLVLMLELTGRPEKSDEIIENGLSKVQKYRNRAVIRQITALKALIYLRRGDLSYVANWANESGLNVADEPDYESELPYLTFVRWEISQGRAGDVLPLLTRMRESAEKGSRRRIVLEIQVLRAIAEKESGNESLAHETLEEALRLGAAENFIRTFADEGEAVTLLLAAMLKQRGKTWESEAPEILRFALLLTESLRHHQTASAFAMDSPTANELPWWYLNDPLSEREIEVLTLVAQGLSNQDIGRKLFIAAGTVKRHINNIYGKLDVHSRVQAIELARKFQLIPPTI